MRLRECEQLWDRVQLGFLAALELNETAA
jgi:hypothetical protein